ncbi:MAG TPA: crossover junction endodeoxyribonuclease RuvC [Candidatus Paceibacterota bacterium]|nr:crossover junction endodeoxyribonuclease RuvC [Candidatus Paceibacterota bacterium]
MRILAIDPGYDRMGIAVVEGDPSKPSYVWSTCVTPPKGEASQRLAVIADALVEALDTYAPDLLAIESLFFGTNKTTAIGVAEARGAVLAEAGRRNLPVREISPQHVKLAVTGYGAAEKKAVMAMIPRLITLPSAARLDDELDAIAVGIAALASRYPHA